MIFAAFGTIDNPFKQLSTSTFLQNSAQGSGLFVIMNVLVKSSIVVAGLYAFLNILIAGYGFLSSPEPKEMAKSWGRIWQSMLGLLIVAGSFVLAAIFGYIIFGDATALLIPKIFSPN